MTLSITSFDLVSRQSTCLQQVKTFPVLQRFRINSDLTSVRPLTDLFQKARMPNLQHLQVSLSPRRINEREAPHWTNLFRILPSTASKLKCFVLDSVFPLNHAGWSNLKLLTKDLEHLSEYDLTMLWVYPPISSALSLDNISRYLLCWRNLESLTLNTPSLGFEVLVVIAQTLFKLGFLGIHIDGRQLPTADSIPILESSLGTLIISGDLEQPLALVRLIDRIFPNLRYTSFAPYQETENDMWTQAKLLLNVLREARSDERARSSHN
ncbi:hypothetical protein NLJ89_g9207 [Agrocybe chaxingu]|uniref:Uncharacterized protein n=1 Tax=Agrocybe chaxingu TaxID=84603 RepID=A0A9W8K0E5_9AGAR|nr:hypothetical protein NLJ89_g9207 [Agrocybe chaxingu]